jgi:hypothetical protein
MQPKSKITINNVYFKDNKLNQHDHIRDDL